MLHSQRNLCAHLWTILQKSTSSRIATSIPVNFSTTGTNVILKAHHGNLFISVEEPCSSPPLSFTVAASALKEISGRKGNVSMGLAAGKVCCRWHHKGLNREASFDTVKAEVPDMPVASDFVVNKPVLIKALDDAMKSAANDSIRYALDKVQLRGSGEIIGTDGRQILLQKGFHFPWKKDLLIPKCGAFAAGVLPNEDVHVGFDGKHVIFKVGVWTIALVADLEGRFPSVDQIVPKEHACTLQLTKAEADFLSKTLRQLPGSKDKEASLTFDLNGKVAIRSKVDGESPTEVVLTQSTSTGKKMTFVAGWPLFVRALQLGFTQAYLINADSPVVCKDATRIFAWMPLEKSLAVPPSKNANRILAPVSPAQAATQPPENAETAQKASPAADEAAPARGARKRRRLRMPEWWNNLRHLIPVLRFAIRSAIEKRFSNRSK